MLLFTESDVALEVFSTESSCRRSNFFAENTCGSRQMYASEKIYNPIKHDLYCNLAASLR